MRECKVFLVYIDDLSIQFNDPKPLHKASHSDDLAIWTQADSVGIAQTRILDTISIVEQCAKDWGGTINESKTMSTQANNMAFRYNTGAEIMGYPGNPITECLFHRGGQTENLKDLDRLKMNAEEEKVEEEKEEEEKEEEIVLTQRPVMVTITLYKVEDIIRLRTRDQGPSDSGRDPQKIMRCLGFGWPHYTDTNTTSRKKGIH
ncbi:hypothetical protein EGW08_009128 [Elysia chlorotica]|uniref:Reverse transcriptase domain-containing protein n=1 Tax=Elysia chlorotica TaxID=188477 RepID=A0A433TNL3_ELYCH|nr:hypothetical protein EGW08_009128 [Elysia chlorotica]